MSDESDELRRRLQDMEKEGRASKIDDETWKLPDPAGFDQRGFRVRVDDDSSEVVDGDGGDAERTAEELLDALDWQQEHHAEFQEEPKRRRGWFGRRRSGQL